MHPVVTPWPPLFSKTLSYLPTAWRGLTCLLMLGTRLLADPAYVSADLAGFTRSGNVPGLAAAALLVAYGKIR